MNGLQGLCGMEVWWLNVGMELSETLLTTGFHPVL